MTKMPNPESDVTEFEFDAAGSLRSRSFFRLRANWGASHVLSLPRSTRVQASRPSPHQTHATMAISPFSSRPRG
ncbi:MAG TPA: hypothetical protein VM163_13645 [bacterium]|nr:hypothetical protein [bacterium]